jgi:hypothetical protein
MELLADICGQVDGNAFGVGGIADLRQPPFRRPRPASHKAHARPFEWASNVLALFS